MTHGLYDRDTDGFRETEVPGSVTWIPQEPFDPGRYSLQSGVD